MKKHYDGYAEHIRQELFLRCRGLAAWQNPDKEKKLVKKVYSPPRSFLAAVEAKSTLEARRSRGTCTLEQDDMHAASDHGGLPTTRIERVCRLGHGRRSAWRQLVMASARLQMDDGDARRFRLIKLMRSLVRCARKQAKKFIGTFPSERVFVVSSSAMLPVLLSIAGRMAYITARSPRC
jgi:hypothetical protein